MPKIKALRAKQIVNALLKGGFYVHHRAGSHVQLRHRQKVHLRVTVPRHDKFDLPVFVVKNILKQAELTEMEFLKLL
jgi:predicted RNA binding protein YcfA (HicA-like mRNA interferase family)